MHLQYARQHWREAEDKPAVAQCSTDIILANLASQSAVIRSNRNIEVEITRTLENNYHIERKHLNSSRH
jgi:hypothetical protein